MNTKQTTHTLRIEAMGAIYDENLEIGKPVSELLPATTKLTLYDKLREYQTWEKAAQQARNKINLANLPETIEQALTIGLQAEIAKNVWLDECVCAVFNMEMEHTIKRLLKPQ